MPSSLLSGLSIRRTSAALAVIGVKRSHEAIRKWIHRFGEQVKRVMAFKAGEVAVVDETLVNFAGRGIYLWVALAESRALI